ncbi:hypothetical protein SAMN00808754_1624 [Thermanaeromonas toyohensis ToBE]|uniref:Uncharacterized protein n=1 Tax=Thermanaeromonas toyohensis ToBE TaxID=698762 RepID=A0A1W1VV40_9FIRM|nr:hypothetical protein [Thermanaeromonas toyohensis]SMB96744.1 hypothetical protein SAMN00808754_1624 [Thermanaeromonas toyohensis ToBE]
MLRKVDGAQAAPDALQQGVEKDVWLDLWERFDAWVERRYIWFFYFAFGYLAVQVVRALVD